MKRFFALAVVLSVCLSLVSCGGNDRASAESVVEDAIKAFQRLGLIGEKQILLKHPAI